MRNDIKINSGQMPVRRKTVFNGLAKPLVTGLIAMLVTTSASAAPVADNVLQNCLFVSKLSKITTPQKLLVLDMAGVSYREGDPLHLWDYTNGANQRFALNYVQASLNGGAIYNVAMHHSGFCMKEAGTATPYNGLRVVQKDCLRSQVIIDSNGDGTYLIRSTNDRNYVVDVALDKAVGNGSTIHMWTSTNGDNQKWYIWGCQDMKGNLVSPRG
jgi:Ricin-type beta-trefoil lectin domain-like